MDYVLSWVDDHWLYQCADCSSDLLRCLRCSDTLAPGYHKCSERVNKPIATYISFNYRVIIPPRVSLLMQMSARLLNKVWEEPQRIELCLGGNIMSKNFSVEWLSQSFHAQHLDNTHKPCDASSETLHLIGEVEDKAPTSPMSKYDFLSLKHALCLSCNLYAKIIFTCIW